MRHTLLATTTLAIGITLAGCNGMGPPTQDPDSFVDHGPGEVLTYTPEQIEWQDGPASLEEGAQMAVLEGDPSQPEIFNMRLRLPDDFVINPHTHPRPERVTVLEGTFNYGHGEAMDPDATNAYGPGSYVTMPAGHAHYAIAEGETIIQLVSTGPWEIDYINPEHDPRR